MKRLSNKVALITGGAGGIGLATAKLFVAEGARVVLADLDEQALQAAVKEIGSDAVSHVAGDVTREDQVRNMIDTVVQRHGRVDVVFANAGTEGSISPLVDYTVEAFDRVMAVNVRGVFLPLKHAIPVMQKQGGGSIVITSSIAGLKGFAGLSAYVASKHAVVGLMRSAVLEVGNSGVRINTIHPSPIDNRMMRSIEEGAAPGAAATVKAQFETMIPAGRYGLSEEVARTALFLASDESTFCTGGRYCVDGGMSAG
ncbi:glucose 1-dehydrogenase [Aquabacterium sp.]|uniref:SDR family NAD(P)-dependent oxidoreductase n=1 Tax=Aquabacterium sp. TaxID=1872578 RepID=UPI0026284E96|nr:glucose 1-dehydrogenase [Aquabacterium sp.]MDD2978203.1 glucose 1-dehydrogenase [Aquabacterium sp.]